MAKVTSKLQVTIPKNLALRYRIRAGDEIQWSASGDSIRIAPLRGSTQEGKAFRLKLFDAATARQRLRQSEHSVLGAPPDRQWLREDLYQRGRAD